MQVTVCDLCEKRIEPFALNVKHNGTRFRISVQKANGNMRGRCWKLIDLCESCFIKILQSMVAQPEEAPSVAQEARQDTAEAGEQQATSQRQNAQGGTSPGC